jgi:D-xylose transport system permease protein
VMNPFIVTLGTLGIARGLALVVSDGETRTGLPHAVETLGSGTLAGIPVPVLLVAGLALAVGTLLGRTQWGRWIYAVGGNPEAARRAGINVTAIRVTAFVAASSLAAAGGILAASRLVAVNQSSGGSDILLNAIAAAVIGGTSLFGGRGRTYAALLGILVIQSITNGMLLLNVDSSVRFMVTASVLALAVAIDSLARKGRPGGAR